VPKRRKKNVTISSAQLRLTRKYGASDELAVA
jgi:hypothetical protein